MNPLTVLRDAFHFFSRHLPGIAPLCLPLIAAECLARAVVASLVDTDHSPAYELLVGLLWAHSFLMGVSLYVFQISAEAMFVARYGAQGLPLDWIHHQTEDLVDWLHDYLDGRG